VDRPQGAIGLVVDVTVDVIQVAPADILPYDGDWVEGSFRIDERSILILDIGQLATPKQA
jgi:hypothetical protein